MLRFLKYKHNEKNVFNRVNYFAIVSINLVRMTGIINLNYNKHRCNLTNVMLLEIRTQITV